MKQDTVQNLVKLYVFYDDEIICLYEVLYRYTYMVEAYIKYLR